MKLNWASKLFAFTLSAVLIVSSFDMEQIRAKEITSSDDYYETTDLFALERNTLEAKDDLSSEAAPSLKEDYVPRQVTEEFILTDWDYTLDSENEEITLNAYIGSEIEAAVCLPASVTIDNVSFQTIITATTTYTHEDNGTIIGSIAELSFEEGFVLPVDCTGLFKNNTNLTSIDFTGVDAAGVTSMSQMFYGCSGLTNLEFGEIVTENVENMSRMFLGCSGLTELNVTAFDTSNVTNMYQLFRLCSELTILDLSAFDCINVTNMGDCFGGCNALTSITVPRNLTVSVNLPYAFYGTDGTTYTTLPTDLETSFTIYSTKPIEDWEYVLDHDNRTITLTAYIGTATNICVPKNFTVGNVVYTTIINRDTSFASIQELSFEEGFVLPESCHTLFYQENSLTSIDFSGVDSNNVTDITYMFGGCNNLTKIDLDDLDTSNVTRMEYVFNSCGSLTSVNVSGFNTSKVESMCGMFASCYALTNLDVSGFDTSNVTHMGYMFTNCSSLTSIDISGFNTSKVTDMTWMFAGCNNLTELDVSGFDTSNVTNMGSMFSGCSSLSNLDLTEFDTSNVINMGVMFYGCSSLSNLDLSGFDTSNVTTMDYMFSGCSSLTSLDLSGFDTSKATDMSGMFSGCSNLINLDVSGFNTDNVKFIHDMFYGCSSLIRLDISGFVTGNVTDMSNMFYGCSSLVNVDVRGFDTNSVKDMSYMFYDCRNITSLDLSGFAMSSVQKASGMISQCTGLTSIYVPLQVEISIALPTVFYDEEGGSYTELPRSVSSSYFIFTDASGGNDYFLKGWSYTKDNSSQVLVLDRYDGNKTSVCLPISTKYNGIIYSIAIDSETMYGSIQELSFEEGFCLDSCETLFSGQSGLISISFSGVDTSNVTNMSGMFGDCNNLTSIDLRGLDTSNVVSISGMFEGCSSLTSLDLSGFDTSNVTNMRGMFYGCSSLSNLDLSGFDTSNVTTMYYMFSGCSSLSNLDLSEFDTSNVIDMSGMFGGCNNLTSIDLRGLDTSNVTNMSDMFGGCNNLTSIDLRGLDTSNVTNMGSMFSGCSSLSNLDLTEFDTSNVINMGVMFYGCSSLSNLDLSGFDTSNVTTMAYMFIGCSSLTSLDLSGFDTSNVTNMSCMFGGCNNLTSIDLRGLDTSNVVSMSSMFYGCSGLSNLDLSGFDTSNVTTMDYMFSGCSSLTSLDLSGFDTSNVTTMYYMFSGCSSLQVIDIPLNVGYFSNSYHAYLPATFYTIDGISYTSLPQGCRSSFRIYRRYTVTWVIDGAVEADFYLYGFMPSHKDAVKAPDAQYTYTFVGWEPEVTAVTRDATYTAIFTGTVNNYTIVWEDEDGTVLEIDEQIPYGTSPSYDGPIPEKATTDAETFEFVGWTPEVEMVTGDAVYTAVFTSKKRTYIITWQDEDGTVLDTQNVEYGITPEYNGEIPKKAATEQYLYTFVGWDPEITAVTGNATYTATFTATLRSYTVRFVNEYGRELQREDLAYGETPEYKGEIPKKAATEQYLYTFVGWDPEITAVTGNATYTATFTATLRSYTVTFVDEDGTVLDTQKVEYGKTPEYNGASLVREADAQYIYSFSWVPEITVVTGDMTYTAKHTSTLRWYTVTFVDDDGTILQSEEIAYGDTPEYYGAIPEKAATTRYTYSFVGWTPQAAIVTGPATYTAVYKAEEIKAEEVLRIFGNTRYKTGIKIADELKEELGVDKFEAVILATGKEFADALSGSYLSAVKTAPILLVRENDLNTIKKYIKNNLAEGGTVYILGGTGAVPEEWLDGLDGFERKRLSGSTRYTTNLEILREAGIPDGSEILIATGESFADSLSASSTGKPILLVKKSLNKAQKTFLEEIRGKGVHFTILGGTGAVSDELKAEIEAYTGTSIDRIAGNTRYATTVLIAERYFPNAESVLLATAVNYPDGLCAGLLGATRRAPVILCTDEKTKTAANYCAKRGLHAGVVLGGTSILSDETVRTILNLTEDVEIVVK